MPILKLEIQPEAVFLLLNRFPVLYTEYHPSSPISSYLHNNNAAGALLLCPSPSNQPTLCFHPAGLLGRRQIPLPLTPTARSPTIVLLRHRGTVGQRKPSGPHLLGRRKYAPQHEQQFFPSRCGEHLALVSFEYAAGSRLLLLVLVLPLL
ncbi:unnamed protein product, partial [Laminaria digitata]